MEITYSIDTNVYAALLSGDQQVADILEKADILLMPTIVIGELYAGFYGGSKLQKNIDELNAFCANPKVIISNITPEISIKFGQIFAILRKTGKPIPTNDIWIAACAISTNSKLLTLDSDFNNIVDLNLVNISNKV